MSDMTTVQSAMGARIAVRNCVDSVLIAIEPRDRVVDVARSVLSISTRALRPTDHVVGVVVARSAKSKPTTTIGVVIRKWCDRGSGIGTEEIPKALDVRRIGPVFASGGTTPNLLLNTSTSTTPANVTSVADHQMDDGHVYISTMTNIREPYVGFCVLDATSRSASLVMTSRGCYKPSSTSEGHQSSQCQQDDFGCCHVSSGITPLGDR